MKKCLVFVLSCLCLLSFTGKMYAFSTAGTCKVQGTTVYLTWIEQDNDGSHVFASTGDVTASPSTWSSQEITVNGVGVGNVTIPHLYINSVGNALAVWEYYDGTANKSFVGASVLDSGTWTSQRISDNNDEICIFSDEIGTIDDDGNMVVTWTSYDESTENAFVRCAIGLVFNETITWDNSFTIPAGGPLAMAKKTAPAKKPLPKPNPKKK